MTQYAAYLGIDWADKKHDLCLVDATTGKKTKLVLAHTPQALAEYFNKLNTQYPDQLIAVGLDSRVDHYCLRSCSTTFWCSIPSTRRR